MLFMSWALFFLGLVWIIREWIKELKQPVVPASYWRNKELILEDELDVNVSAEQFLKNLESGKYYLPNDNDDIHTYTKK